MQCTEVWGGNELVERGVIMTGLDVWVFSRPFEGDEEGGDIHYLSSCSTGRVARALVADVSGHGAVVAGTAKRLRSVMRRYANFINQSKLVGEVNREFAGLAKAGHFATAVVATFWGPSREIEITNAGHPLPLLYRAREGKWEALKGESQAGETVGDIPLGIDDVTTYSRMRTRLERGDLILFYTDALIEANDAAGAMLGTKGLLAALASLNAGAPETLIPRLLAAVEAGEGGNVLADDTTLMLLRANDLRAGSSFMEGLRATGRVLWEFARSLRPGGGPIPWPELSLNNILGIWSEAFYRDGRK
jgi:sigma-B regulation protein RsbU (phosphoserine phosphatase)